MKIEPLFQPIDAMQVRTQLGDMLDKVLHTKQRFVIQRRGKAKALLVPITDADHISHALENTNDELNAVYAAFDRARGVITDPALHDASQTIDAWVYGERRSDEEDNAG
jgi:hypothetical protein